MPARCIIWFKRALGGGDVRIGPERVDSSPSADVVAAIAVWRAAGSYGIAFWLTGLSGPPLPTQTLPYEQVFDFMAVGPKLPQDRGKVRLLVFWVIKPDAAPLNQELAAHGLVFVDVVSRRLRQKSSLKRSDPVSWLSESGSRDSFNRRSPFGVASSESPGMME